ncbi:MAG: glycerol-3-phosphate 1-O-acyltransferase PlsY [Planctomycetes bacterium]|nr:glycerol-3-phosphate 1-O-acyltransferase PlsY [Planctomycetota bacterium]
MFLAVLAAPETPLLLAGAWSWVAIGLAYLVGGIPFGLILARVVKGVDIRSIGSGNIGATNAIRAMGRKWGYLVFALDFLKGLLPTWSIQFLFTTSSREDVELLQILVGAAATLGHCYSPYLGFTGGKGVATGCGGILALSWPTFVAGGLVWLATRLGTGYAGLASILMGVAFPVAVAVQHGTERRAMLAGATALAALIVWRHRSNIQRMLAGTEPNARKKRGEPPPAARPHG